MTATRQLTVHNAQITTATVEVKTLTISGKQVTLAVFRQLREEPLITDDGYLNGVAWGVVNYHPDKCSDRADHWHVVWQRGTELLRSLVYKIPMFPEGIYTHEGDRFLAACIVTRINGGNQWFNGDSPWIKDDGPYGRAVVDVTCDGKTFSPWHATLEPTEVSRKAAEAHMNWQRASKTFKDRDDRYASDTVDTLKGEAEKAQADLLAEYESWEASPEELFTAYREAAQREWDRRMRHKDIRATLADLPQLFIAA